MSKHTPGPWESYRDGDRIHIIRQGTLELLNSSGSHVRADWIAEIDPDGTGHAPEQTEANACLIAAAPDLLAACKAYMDASGASNGRPETDSPAEALMRAAIAKAEGGQP